MAKLLLFQGNILTATTNFMLSGSTPNCSLEVKINSNLTSNLTQRLISCPDSKLWTTDVSSGITNKDSKIKYCLEDVSLNCSRQSISGYNQIKWQANLQISQSAHTADPGPPFDKIVIGMICACMDCNGLNVRHDVIYLVKSKLQINITEV